ncbi:MAG: polysaccharide deacetylase family protein [Allosphingosinicella sp.]|uniref:polysaccharide deacetylase family protein n=1 Tax=Allosphingosinicella sp. TaxID=2823234 RepID=UPI00395A62E4
MLAKRILLELAGRAGLAPLARRATARHLRILGYHGAWLLPGPPLGECTFITPALFERRMTRLKRSGHPVLSLTDAVSRLADGSLPNGAVVITIDDGWVSTLTHMVPILEALELPASLYATTWYSERDLPVVTQAVRFLARSGGRPEEEAKAAIARIEALPVEERLAALRAYGTELGVAEEWLERRQFHIMSASELAEAQRRGIDIQLHTHRHIEVAAHHGRLGAEIEENRACLAAALGIQGFDHFCYPSGSFHETAPAILAAAGVRSATLCDPGLNRPGADPLTLKRLLDGWRVSDAEFDAYLSGVMHALSPLSSAAAALTRVRAR